MYLHKENRELFRDVVLLTSERMNVAADIVEKDYYVTMILKILSGAEYKAVFKGGTSLSKAYGIIDRFSEDIDITFTEHLGVKRRRRLKYEILWPIARELGLDIKNWDSIESNKNYNHYDYYYEPITDFSQGGLQPYVKLETALMSYAFPTAKREIGNYIYQALFEEESELMAQYGLEPFPMSVQSMERTLIDKIFALCDYYIQGKPERNSRHLYDIYKLANYTEKNDAFRKLVCEVREHRATMSETLAPSARADVDVKRLIHKLCEEDFYGQDYSDITSKLISDRLDYEVVRDFYLRFTDDLF